MISALRGKLIEKGKGYVILDVQGVGYRVHIGTKALNSLPKTGETVNLGLFTKMIFDQREGSFELFGFLDKDDVDLFDLLISISGIGPKKAMTIMSSVDREKLFAAVIKEDSDYLSDVGGLGAKTSKRLIVELKDKIEKSEFVSLAKVDLTGEGEAVSALVSLGFEKHQALGALKKVSRKAKNVEEKVKEALKILSRV